ncbi:hypothetical protein BH11BAC2_BH11BAC2_25070 [soil metagenome]
MKNEKYFLLFANCIPVRGAVRSGICDLQCGIFQSIPNSLFDILQECEDKSIVEIYSGYDNAFHSDIDKFFDWLIELNFGIWCKDKSERKLFPKIENKFDYPFHVSNIIIDINEHSKYDVANVIRQVIAAGIPYIQIRAYSYKSSLFFFDLLNLLEGSRVRGIDIVTPYYEGAEDTEFDKLCKEHLRINSITYSGASFNSIQEEIGGNTKIIFTTSQVLNDKCCGIVSPDYFTINKELFFESHHFNSCLNRKISVDVNGNIKNCPSMQKIFGNIKNTALQSVMQYEGFTKSWNIKKDEIKVCKDCEFRYICTDCRAFVEDHTDPHSKPLKCGYDPYTATWMDWATNPNKEKAMLHYGMPVNLPTV